MLLSPRLFVWSTVINITIAHVGPAIAEDAAAAASLELHTSVVCRLKPPRSSARDRSWSTVINITVAHVGPALAAYGASSHASSLCVGYPVRDSGEQNRPDIGFSLCNFYDNFTQLKPT